MAKGKYSKKNAEPSAAPVSEAPEKEAVAPVLPRSETASAEKNLIDLDFERQAAQYTAGQEETTYGIFKYIYKLNQWIDRHKKPHTFKKKVYLWLMLFTGWIGGHRWYQGRYVLAAFMTLFFWTGIPAILCVTDFMEVFPLKPDENGMITMK